MMLRLTPVLLLAGSLPEISLGQNVDEYRLKAAFVFNFTKFVEWPASAFKTPADPISICVYGRSPVNDALEQAVQRKTVQDRPLVTRSISGLAQTAGCHLIFVPASEHKQMRAIIEGVAGHTVLLAGESDWFLKEGGDFNLRIESGSVHIQVNPDAVERQGLHVSSKLPSLAEIVRCN